MARALAGKTQDPEALDGNILVDAPRILAM